jgi:ferredoxin
MSASEAKKLVYLADVVTLSLDPERCNGCRMCATVCPRGVWSFEDRRAAIGERDACIECGACARNCAERAISVRSGVGCATAIITSYFSKDEGTCCG